MWDWLLVTLLCLFVSCLVVVSLLFLTVAVYAIVAFPDHTHLLFFILVVQSYQNHLSMPLIAYKKMGWRGRRNGIRKKAKYIGIRKF